ncbi:MAG: response regulator [Acidobacteria bacterium]|nr:MAG: response regulator [Acidobacteriota bacterium]
MKERSTTPGPSRRRAAGVALLLAGAMLASASAGQRYPVRHYTVDDGLPSTRIRDVVQDRRGRIWLATHAGVASYDGRSWRTYNLDDGFTWADQFALRWDAGGVLWAVSSRAPFRLHRFDGERWQPAAGPPDVAPRPSITAFAVLGNDAMRGFAIGTDRGLLYGEAGAWSWLSERPIVALLVHQRRLLVATSDGIATLSPGTGRPLEPLPIALPPGLTGMALETSAAGGEDRLWLIGEHWIGVLRDGRTTLLADGLAIAPPAYAPRLAAAPDYHGGLYFGHASALFHFHPELGLTSIGRDNGLIAGGTSALCLDRENNLWIASNRGLSKLAGRRFASYTRLHGLFADEVTAALAGGDGSVVLGHRGGLTFISGRTITAWPLPPPAASRAPPERVWDLAADAAGRLWIAAGSYGLGRRQPDGSLRWLGAGDGLLGDVTSVVVDAAGRLWAATDRGLFRRRADGGFERQPGLPALHVRRLIPTAGGALLLATASGLHRVAGDHHQSWCDEDAAPCSSVFAALEADDGALWAGTASGLYRTVGSQLARPEEPRIEQPIYFMVRDHQGRVWFGTDNGVLRWDGAILRAFTVRDGLAGRETQRAAGLVDPRGRVWMGTENGVTVYVEPPPGRPPAPPIVELTEVEVGGRHLPLDAPLELAHDDDDLTFRFHVVSLIDEDRVRLSSRLEGFDDAWLTHDLQVAELRYTNLAAGEYRLHLRAMSAEGTWSDVVRSPPIDIARPFWQRPWFFLAVLAVLATGVFSGRRLVSQRRRARWLEEEVDRRVAELTAEQERLVVTLRNIADGVITTDAEGDVIFLNPMAVEITGWTLDEAVGRPLGRVLTLRRAGGSREPYEPFRLLAARNLEALERTETVELVTRTGTRRLVEVSGSPIIQARGQHAGLVVAFRDVSEKQQIEQELLKAQKLDALGILAGGIAHDFNNLLTVLLGSLSLLESGGLDAQRSRHVRSAEAAVRRARDLTQQLLTFARGGTPVREAASIAEVIRESASFVLRGANVRCEIDLPEDLWVVEIDAGQISQVLNNLLLNARQAMPEGGTVRITGKNVLGPSVHLPGERYVAIDVSDEGTGIASEDLGRIFDPYFTTKETGRGLGLASAYSIVKQHDGLLTVSSRLGEGTTFRLYLPASDAQPPEPLVAHEMPSVNGGGRILIMDDDEAVRTTTGAMVERLGFRAAYAADGLEAIAAYQRALAEDQPFAAVIMDLTIPGGMGGKETIRRLREIDPAVRAVVISGYSNDPVLANHRQYGFMGRISKPFDVEVLARVLSEVAA